MLCTEHVAYLTLDLDICMYYVQIHMVLFLSTV